MTFIAGIDTVARTSRIDTVTSNSISVTPWTLKRSQADRLWRSALLHTNDTSSRDGRNAFGVRPCNGHIRNFNDRHARPGSFELERHERTLAGRGDPFAV